MQLSNWHLKTEVSIGALEVEVMKQHLRWSPGLRQAVTTELTGSLTNSTITKFTVK